jgi:60 kDa SS-A/Ro ribonucleoprotein
MSNYLRDAASEVASPPQSKPLNERQVPNSAGGYTFAVDDWKRLDRFLILGSEGGSYYATERKLTVENIEAVKRCVANDGPRTVHRIVEISDEGRAPKNDPALLALAYAAGKGNDETRKAALDALPYVARIGTHLFHFVAFVRQFRGWGRGLRRAIENWYMIKTPDQLADQVTKYQQRDGWSHRDLLRLDHVKYSGAHHATAHWVVKGHVLADGCCEKATGPVTELPKRIEGHIKLQAAKSAGEAASLIREYGLVRESVPTEFLNHKEVWQALLEKMPMTAMIRNLGNLSKCGLLVHMSQAAKDIAARLIDQEAIRKARVHPIQLLIAAKTYESGHSLRGSGEWTPVPKIVDALDAAFYLAFQNVTPTGKNFYLGMDISGSMWGHAVAGIPNFFAAIASGAMAMVTVKSEENCYAAGFTCRQSGRYGGRWDDGKTGMTPIAFSSKQRLDDVLRLMKALEERMGGTDCALPMLDALEKKIPIDTFVVYTDNETWAGSVHPVNALEQYRQKMGRPAKLIVCGMVSNEFTIADPNDAGMLDVVGFDTATPQIVAEFAKD